jgi:ATP-dependent Zn protease
VKHRAIMDSIAETLLKQETLEREAFADLVGIPKGGK